MTETECRRLWAAVLEQAFEDAQARGLEDAKKWFISEKSEVGSFLWICDALDIDPQALRTILTFSRSQMAATPATSALNDRLSQYP